MAFKYFRIARFFGIGKRDQSTVQGTMMIIPEECLENGHSFIMRTHDIAPTPEQMEAAGSLSDDYWDIDEVNSMISQLTTRNYVCDVCEHCGFTVGIQNQD